MSDTDIRWGKMLGQTMDRVEMVGYKEIPSRDGNRTNKRSVKVEVADQIA
jgi:hypothetical protein